MATPSTQLEICNMTLGRIGAKRITQAQLDASPITDTRAQHCDLHYDQTRRALIRSHWWRFAKARSSLTATTTPSFEWDYAFTLPTDFLAMRNVFEDNNTPKNNTIYSYSLEGNLLLTNESTCKIRYTKEVTTVTSFDPLFIEVLVLQHALKIVMPITQDNKTYQQIKDDLYGTPRQKGLMSKVRAMDRQEQETLGVYDAQTWLTYFETDRNPLKLGSN
jgi:hypothetical protein